MERILLVEPNYKNKYPPIGLMKISTYYKSKGDFVQFHKGLLPVSDAKTYNRVFVTTLFTFDFDMCVETIRYYAAIVGNDNVYIGGIAATILPVRFEASVPGVHLLKGQLTSSQMLGYEDHVNIDILELDYDILWDISYDYPSADSYFIYTSRGCPRKCPFCAVKTLEPDFYECTNVREQIERVDASFGIKKTLLIMDNNSLYAPHLSETVDTLVALGFGNGGNTIKRGSDVPVMLQSLFARLDIGKAYTHLLQRIKKKLFEIKLSRISNIDAAELAPILHLISTDNEAEIIKCLKEKFCYLNDFFKRYNHHKIKRYVDFNQGLDARFFTKHKAELLSQLALKPCRFAFDDIHTRDDYFKAIDLATSHGIKHFSNYLLYNYEDCPEDLWKRLFLNVDYCEKHSQVKSLFSFPMKYASIEHTDRNYIGQHWNKKYLKSINVILNVTSGVVAKEKDFFLRAYGHNLDEFFAILTMPDDFIRYRDYFEKHGLPQRWAEEYQNLTQDQRDELLKLLSNVSSEVHVVEQKHDPKLDSILRFYTVKKVNMEKNEVYYLRLFQL